MENRADTGESSSDQNSPPKMQEEQSCGSRKDSSSSEVMDLFRKFSLWREESQVELTNVIKSYNNSVNEGFYDLVKEVCDLQAKLYAIKKEWDDWPDTVKGTATQHFKETEEVNVQVTKDNIEHAELGKDDEVVEKPEDMTTTMDHNCQECNDVFSSKEDFIFHMQNVHEPLKTSEVRTMEDKEESNLLCKVKEGEIQDTQTSLGQKLQNELEDPEEFEINRACKENGYVTYQSKPLRADNKITENDDIKHELNEYQEDTLKSKTVNGDSREQTEQILKGKTGGFRLIGHKSKVVDKIMCELCLYETSSRNNLRAHIIGVHEDKKDHTCGECSYATSRRSSLKRHIIDVHRKIKNHVCGECGYACNQKSTLRAHRAMVHKIGENKFKCQHCTYTAPYNGMMKKHLVAVHEKIKNNVCEDCGSAFATKSNLSGHIESVHHKGDTQMKCEQCPYVAACKAYLKTHMYSVHNKVKKHICKECGYATDKKYYLKGHMVSVHKIGEKEFKCNICSYATVRPEYVKIHIDSVHKKIKKYICEECGYAAAQRRNLTVHKDLVHNKGDKKFLCEQCPYTSNLKANLTTHIEGVHEKIRKHVCQDCGYASKLKSTLKKHRESVHKMGEKM